MDLLDLAIALFELTFGYLDSISNLDLKLGVIPDSLAQSLIVQEIPLVLIVIIEFVEVRLSCWIDLEHFYLLEARTDVLGDQLRGVKFLVQETVSKHHFSPDVEILAQRLDVLLLAFVLHSEWIEQLLRDPDEMRLFIVSFERVQSLRYIMVEVFRDPGDQSNHGLLVAIYGLDQPKVIFVDSTLDSDPLMLLESLLDGDFASLHDLSHFVDRNHFYRAHLNS